MRLIHVQPGLPIYRTNFFDRLKNIFGKDMIVYCSPGNLGAIDENELKDWLTILRPVRTLPLKIFWQPDVAWLKIKSEDIFILSGNPRYLSTLILFLRAKIKGARVVWWGHYWSSSSKRWRQILRFLPMAAADALLFYTEDEIASYCNDPAVLIRNKKRFALNNGINVEPIKKYREEYCAASRENAILFIGRITEKANLALLLRAMSKIDQGCPKLYVIGDGEELSSSKKLSVELNLDGRVEWCGGLKEESEISRFANKCKLFVYPGSVGLSLIHAMAYGLPAIVHDNRRLHMPEIAAFKEGVTGSFFSHNNPESLSEIIKALLACPSFLDELSKNAKAIVDSDFNTAAMASRFKAMIDDLNG